MEEGEVNQDTWPKSVEEGKVVHVIVGKNFRKDKATLLWTLRNFHTEEIVIVHVHQTSKWVSFWGSKKFRRLGFARERCISLHKVREIEAMKKLLSRYAAVCLTRNVRTEYIEDQDQYIGTQRMIQYFGITRLVLSSRSMSKKFGLVSRCHILLVRKGKFVSSSSDPAIQHRREISVRFPGDEEVNQGNSDHTMHDESESYVTALMSQSNDDMTVPHDHDNGEYHKNRYVGNEPGNEKGNEQESRIAPTIKEYTMEELIAATDGFDKQNLVGVGGYGPVYKGTIGGELAAIKFLNPKSNQGRPQFNMEVRALSRVNHPNIMKLHGVCTEYCALVYEYLPNDTLEKGLANNLPWEQRARIICEQRLALICLHSSQPDAIVHGDIKPSNILLDSSNKSRLGDFGIARLVYHNRLTGNCDSGTPMGTPGYMDPAILTTGEVNQKSDVYSFGIVILQMLTGLGVMNIADQVDEAIHRGIANDMLDKDAGNWPRAQTKLLLRLALNCCNVEREFRPSLLSEKDWRPLLLMQAMAEKSQATSNSAEVTSTMFSTSYCNEQ